MSRNVIGGGEWQANCSRVRPSLSTELEVPGRGDLSFGLGVAGRLQRGPRLRVPHMRDLLQATGLWLRFGLAIEKVES